MNLLSIEHRNAAIKAIAPELPQRCAKVFEAVKRIEPCTRQELADYLKLPINQVTGRVTELRDNHVLIKEVDSRKNALSNHDCTTIETFKDPIERMEAIYKRKRELDRKLEQLSEDMIYVRTRAGIDLLKAEIERTEKRISELKKK